MKQGEPGQGITQPSLQILAYCATYHGNGAHVVGAYIPPPLPLSLSQHQVSLSFSPEKLQCKSPLSRQSPLFDASENCSDSPIYLSDRGNSEDELLCEMSPKLVVFTRVEVKIFVSFLPKGARKVLTILTTQIREKNSFASTV